MLYITYRLTPYNEELTIKNIWNVKYTNVEDRYIEFIHIKAIELNVVISPTWLNVMNFEDHNTHLTEVEYQKKVKQWSKIMRQWNIDKFISEVLKGYKENYTDIIRY